MVGQGWSVESYTGEKVNLVGFDNIHAQKNQLPLVTALTVIEHPEHGNVILRANQVVLNESSKTTLLSEYQLSEYGCMIDMKPMRH